MAEHENGPADEAPHEASDGTPVQPKLWIVDYLGDGEYCVGHLRPDGSLGIVHRTDQRIFGHREHSEFQASAHATVYASPGDTIVFSPAFALVYALHNPAVLSAVLNRVTERMPRRKHCPQPLWHTDDGIGIVKGNVHADQHAVFSSTIAVNGFNLGLNGCNCAGTRRRWEWVEPRGGESGGSGAAGWN